jgi:hypothetical protein
MGPTGTEKMPKVIDALAAFTDVAQWRLFCFKRGNKNVLFSIKSRKLDDNLGTPKVYIVDKKRNLRGRKLVKTPKKDTTLFTPQS